MIEHARWHGYLLGVSGIFLGGGLAWGNSLLFGAYRLMGTPLIESPLVEFILLLVFWFLGGPLLMYGVQLLRIGRVQHRRSRVFHDFTEAYNSYPHDTLTPLIAIMKNLVVLAVIVFAGLFIYLSFDFQLPSVVVVLYSSMLLAFTPLILRRFESVTHIEADASVDE